MIEIDPSIRASFDNARDLLRAPRRVLADEKLPNIAFHAPALAEKAVPLPVTARLCP
jgi:hypothetical protein